MYNHKIKIQKKKTDCNNCAKFYIFFNSNNTIPTTLTHKNKQRTSMFSWFFFFFDYIHFLYLLLFNINKSRSIHTGFYMLYFFLRCSHLIIIIVITHANCTATFQFRLTHVIIFYAIIQIHVVCTISYIWT